MDIVPADLRPNITNGELLQIVQQRDDLLAALQELAEWAAKSINVPLEECVSGSIGKANAALSRALGTPAKE